MDEAERAKQQIDGLVKSKPVVLFMKGTRSRPQCGFSATVVGLLDDLLPAYETVDVLADEAIRTGVKEYSGWPTIPQLFVGGALVGGCDIVKQLAEQGELAKVLGAEAVEIKPPSLRNSDRAARMFTEAAKDAEGEPLRFEVNARFEYDLFFGPREPGDVEVSANGLAVLVGRSSVKRADGTSIDYVEGAGGAEGGFKIENPNEPARVKSLSVTDLKKMIDEGARFELFDVRTERERAIAKIEPSRLLDAAGQAFIEALPKDATIVLHCHHGGRSQAAAEALVREGFRDVHNVVGGIDAWSLRIDAAVPRY